MEFQLIRFSTKKQSIIDFALTNSEYLVKSFQILKNIIGVSPQTSHKELQLSISLKFKEYVNITPDRVNFNSIGSKKSLYFRNIIASFEKVKKLSTNSINYEIVKIYIRVQKKKF